MSHKILLQTSGSTVTMAFDRKPQYVIAAIPRSLQHLPTSGAKMLCILLRRPCLNQSKIYLSSVYGILTAPPRIRPLATTPMSICAQQRSSKTHSAEVITFLCLRKHTTMMAHQTGQITGTRARSPWTLRRTLSLGSASNRSTRSLM